MLTISAHGFFRIPFKTNFLMQSRSNRVSVEAFLLESPLAGPTAASLQGPRNQSGMVPGAQQGRLRFLAVATLGLSVAACLGSSLRAADQAARVSPNNPTAEAKTAAEMKPYTEPITGTEVQFDMVPIPGGECLIGSPEGEAGRVAAEGPQRKVKISPFWMGKHEVTWDAYDIWSYRLDEKLRVLNKTQASKLDAGADVVTRPTKPYTDMTFGMGHDGYPAICMTQLAAKTYCEWLSAKTGHYYRLPTEAEWEYACRAGTTTAYSFGDDAEKLDDYAWFDGNSEGAYHKIGLKKPNPWGLYDMHGNVMEWTLDQYLPEGYAKLPADQVISNPFAVPSKLYPRTARGGSWEDDVDRLRSAAREPSDAIWKVQDPQIPKSIWYLTDALFLGFRIVRPLEPPTGEFLDSLKETKESQLER